MSISRCTLWQKLCVILSLSMGLTISLTALSMENQIPFKKKIGQMLLVGFKNDQLQPTDAIVKAILNQEIGGVILFDYNYQAKNNDYNIKNPTQLKQLTSQLQAYAKQAAANNHNDLIPLFISVDYEGGKVNRLKEKYGFPATLSAAEIAQLPKAKAEHYAEQMAKTLKDAGINMNFAPVVDINSNPNNPVIGKYGRSFSAKVDKVIDYAEIFSKAYQQQGILCAYKHFPGHGSSTGDTHVSFVDVTHTWQPNELQPYKVLLSQSDSCPMVMTAHVVNYQLDKQGNPASLSHAMTTDLLRNQMHFKGVVVTDDLQMKAITDHYGLATAVRMAINAGADILVFGNQLTKDPQSSQEVIDLIYKDVEDGKIAKERIEQSFDRIMKLKKKMAKSSTSS